MMPNYLGQGYICRTFVPFVVGFYQLWFSEKKS